MTRTHQQCIRRATLADAANGILPDAPTGVSRIRVVLYGRAAIRLRAYAEARDWTVVGHFGAEFALGTALADQPLWPSIAALFEAHRAEGIVTDLTASEADVDDWIKQRGAFVARLIPAGHHETPATA
ncbi:hypothetical protein [Streptomyces sp. PR69]|uniref:hypothetical protein n=1 Tax=Streptomyces sp. PR69 TaxID=2984950 RepID=UPI0022640DD9|nr:hypothetical protein [Streptomyces sp. PR69]